MNITDFTKEYARNMYEGQILNLENRVKRLESIIEGRENADGCQGCKYERKEPWEEPCKICRKNYMDRWEKA